MKGLLENHLNVAALDNDETNKRLTFLFRFEEEFRIPLVKRQQFNSSEAEGLLVIHRGCCRCSANGHGTGFPRTLPATRCPEEAACRRGERRLLQETQRGTGKQRGARVPGLSFVGKAEDSFSGLRRAMQATQSRGWPAERGALVPLHPTSLSLLGWQLRKQTWRCVQW